MLAEPNRYRICVSGLVETAWADEVCGLRVMAERDGYTELVGEISDQSALLGVLRQLRDRRHAVLWLQGEWGMNGDPGSRPRCARVGGAGRQGLRP